MIALAKQRGLRTGEFTEFFDDYLGALDTNRSRTSVSGATASVSGSSLVDHPGIVTLSYSAASQSGFVGSQTLTVWDITTGYTEFESAVMLDVLSDATDTIEVRCGLIDSTTGNATDGYYVYYTHSANSGAWQGIIRRAGSTVGTLNTNMAVVAGTWYRPLIRVNPINGRMELFINGRYLGGVTPSSVLTSSHLTGHGTNANKSGAGTNTQIVTTDFVRVLQYTDR